MSDMIDKNGKLKLEVKDFTSDQEPRWCPGCGDYAILSQMKKILPNLGTPKENIVFVSGIGCSSRFPYYVDVFGIHGIHGRAPVIASGIKLANPDLKVFVFTGDGDGLSIGGNHFIHLCRRNIDITVILFNNRIYGLTKGQYSPTSLKGQITKSSPYGTIESPFNPVQMALASGASFVARSIDRNPKHLAKVLDAASRHKGTSFVEVYQNCVIFNDGTFSKYTDSDKKKDNLVEMNPGEPYVFGKENEKVLNWNGFDFDIEDYDTAKKDSYLRHDERHGHASMEFMLASMSQNNNLPTPIGIFRHENDETYDRNLVNQIKDVKAKKGEGNLKDLLFSGRTWTVE